MSSGEMAVPVFISSVMDDEMQPWRDATVNALESVPYLFTWAFEYTPPSSESVDHAYLRKVRESSLVLWLVGSRTTEPVQREVREALAARVRLLAFRLPCEDRDAETRRLLNETPTKWSPEIRDESEFRDTVQRAVGDEVARAMRGIPALAPVAEYDRLGRESRARCMARWVMAGIEPALAEEWARDRSVASIPSHLRGQSRGVVALVGGMGAGKSLCGERWLQDRILASAVTPGSPIPVYVRADSLTTLLVDTVRDAASGVGSPDTQGVNVLLDDLSRCSDRQAADVLEQAWQLQSMFPTTTVLITTRPVPGVVPTEGPWVIRAELLDEVQALALIERAYGGDTRRLRHEKWAPSLKDAIRWPLFALLAGVYLRERGAAHSISYSELLSFLIERSLRTTTVSRIAASRLLKTLAARTMESESTRVPLSEIGRLAELGDLLESGLIELDKGTIGIPLDILREWLAAQAIVDGEPSIRGLLADPKRLNHWMYPLMAVVGLEDFESSADILASLIERRPALAARVISHETPEYVAGRDNALMSDAKTLGERVLLATECWIEALWPVSMCLTAVDRDGDIRGLGIGINGGAVQTRWRRQGESRAVTVLEPGDTGEDWISYHSAHPPAISGWPWSWALSEVRDPLSRRVRARNVPLAEGPLLVEFAYEIARAVVVKGVKNGDPVAVNHLVNWLEELRAQPGHVVSYHKGILTFDPAQLEAGVHYLKSHGISRLSKPYPAPNPMASPHDTWLWFGGETGIENAVKAVLATALAGYRETARTWFPRLREDLLHFVLQPADIRIRLLRPEHEGYAGRISYVSAIK